MYELSAKNDRLKMVQKLSVYNDKLYRDALTGAYNRRYYEDEIKHVKGKAGVAILDVDDFKYIMICMVITQEIWH